MWKHMAPSFSMLERFTKKLTDKATNGAVSSVKESAQGFLEKYSGPIGFGVTLGVLLFGSGHMRRHEIHPYSAAPQPPIIINNYYQEREVPKFERQKVGQPNKTRR